MEHFFFSKFRIIQWNGIINKEKQSLEVFLESSQNSQENTCTRVFLLNKVADLRPQACNFIKKETWAQVFSCEFCEISWNTFFTEHLWGTIFKLASNKSVKTAGVCVVFFFHYRSYCPELFCKKVVLRNSTKFTGKHLCQSLF